MLLIWLWLRETENKERYIYDGMPQALVGSGSVTSHKLLEVGIEHTFGGSYLNAAQLGWT